MQGVHQLDNASTAIASVIILKKSNYKINLNSLGRSIHETSWPGRIEIIGYKNKVIILDGSHNLLGAEILKQYLIKNNLKPNVIFGMLNNKKALEFLSILKKNIDTLYPINIPGEVNAFSIDEIFKITKRLKIKSIIKNDINIF